MICVYIFFDFNTLFLAAKLTFRASKIRDALPKSNLYTDITQLIKSNIYFESRVHIVGWQHVQICYFSVFYHILTIKSLSVGQKALYFFSAFKRQFMIYPVNFTKWFNILLKDG